MDTVVNVVRYRATVVAKGLSGLRADVAAHKREIARVEQEAQGDEEELRSLLFWLKENGYRPEYRRHWLHVTPSPGPDQLLIEWLNDLGMLSLVNAVEIG